MGERNDQQDGQQKGGHGSSSVGAEDARREAAERTQREHPDLGAGRGRDPERDLDLDAPIDADDDSERFRARENEDESEG